MLETSRKTNGMNFSLLIELGATKSFISHNALSRCRVMASKQEDVHRALEFITALNI